MTRSRRAYALTALATALLLIVSACANGTSGQDSAPDESDTPNTSSSAPEGGSGAAVGKLSGIKVAAVFSGSVTDDDYNQLGFLALHEVTSEGAQATFTENVAVPEAERVIREYVADGNNLIWTHGSQYYAATAKVALDNPGVHFVAEFDGHPDALPDNVWIFDRQFHLGFYAIGVLASKLSKSGTVGYVGGLALPFSYAEVHAMKQAISDLGASTIVHSVWTSNFNDPSKAQQISTRLINDGADVIVGSLNDASAGIFDAAADVTRATVWVTAKYTDKSSLDSGGNYAGTVLYNFRQPLQDVLNKIAAGEVTGYYPLGFTTGVTIQMSDAVPTDIQEAVTDTMERIENGSITVALDTNRVGG